MPIFRGEGGAGDSSTDAYASLVAQNAAIASTKADEASTSASNAASSASSAATSASNANTSATTASTKATEAASSATQASTSASSAATSATSASTTLTQVQALVTDAETAETNASTSATQSAASATASASSATDAQAAQTAAETAESNASTSASTATAQATNAATSASTASTAATSASGSATTAQTAATNAQASYDQFDDRYLGAKASDPTLDNDGDALITGALYFNTSANSMKVYNGTGWADAGSAVNGTSDRNVFVATEGQTLFSGLSYDTGFVDVYLNGVKLIVTTDFTATTGTSVTLTTGATAGDTVDIVAYGAFNVANTYTQAQSDARFVQPNTTPSFTGLDIPVEEQVGGGALVYGKVNLLTDSSTYTLPLANTVSSGDFIIVEKDETNKVDTPTVSRSGSDNIVYSGGTDTDLQFDAETSQAIRFVSNGTDGWRI